MSRKRFEQTAGTRLVVGYARLVIASKPSAHIVLLISHKDKDREKDKHKHKYKDRDKEKNKDKVIACKPSSHKVLLKWTQIIQGQLGGTIWGPFSGAVRPFGGLWRLQSQN